MSTKRVDERTYEEAHILSAETMYNAYNEKKNTYIIQYISFIVIWIIVLDLIYMYVIRHYAHYIELLIGFIVIGVLVIQSVYKYSIKIKLSECNEVLEFIKENLIEHKTCKLRYKQVIGYGIKQVYVWLNDEEIQWFTSVYYSDCYSEPVLDFKSKVICVAEKI